MDIFNNLIPFILSLFLPKSTTEAIIKMQGGTVMWPASSAAIRSSLEARRAALLGRTYAGNASDSDEQELQAIEGKLAAIPSGGILSSILAMIGGGGGGSMLPILIIGGVAFMLMSGGCGGGGMSCTKKPTPVTTQPKAGPVVIDAQNP